MAPGSGIDLFRQILGAAVVGTAAESRVMQGNLLYQMFLQIKINGIPRCVG
jgi:hypothetical protein